MRCPQCDYDLRRLAEPRCLECGYRFEWRQLLGPSLRLLLASQVTVLPIVAAACVNAQVR